MQPCPLSDYVPELIYTMYWERKEKFLFSEDISKEWTVFAVESGSFYYEVGERKGTATFGDLIFCPPHTLLRRVVVTPLTFFVLRMRWYRRDGAQIEPGAQQFHFMGKINIKQTARLADNYTIMRRADQLDERRRLEISGHYFQDIWLQHSMESGEELWAQADVEAHQPDSEMVKAASLIQKRAYEAVDLKTIAAELGLSPARLTQKFKAGYGISPLRYLTNIRLEKAKRLLLETNLTLEQISESLGYTNGYYLNRLFRKHLHTTPSQYRNAHRL